MPLVAGRRTFEVDRMPRLGKFTTETLWKGYLTRVDAPVEVRVDLTDGAHAAIVVSVQDPILGADSRLEVDKVSLTLYRPGLIKLLQLACGEQYVEKTRTTIPLREGLARLHVYHNPPMVTPMVEVEFERGQDLLDFSPPRWFGRELTGDARKDDRQLASGILSE